MKQYILIAGVNGAGKSTLFQANENLKSMERINTDEIVRQIGVWNNPTDVMKAGKIAVRKIQDYFDNGVSFNQETTLCGKSILQNIEKAKSLDYTIQMHYVGVQTVELAKERIRQRVLKGGHGIPEKDVERRYIESFQQLKRVLPFLDLLAMYDNTESFRRFAIARRGNWIRLSHSLPLWFIDNIIGHSEYQ